MSISTSPTPIRTAQDDDEDELTRQLLKSPNRSQLRQLDAEILHLEQERDENIREIHEANQLLAACPSYDDAEDVRARIDSLQAKNQLIAGRIARLASRRGTAAAEDVRPIIRENLRVSNTDTRRAGETLAEVDSLIGGIGLRVADLLTLMHRANAARHSAVALCAKHNIPAPKDEDLARIFRLPPEWANELSAFAHHRAEVAKTGGVSTNWIAPLNELRWRQRVEMRNGHDK